ncbi:MAG: quinol:cytochrome C oxidoreductase [Acidobacteria bacterium]|nr:MAG: quinol:cytochrome C oxidoreductase [Acidobacteriota bacterium]
MTLNDDRLDYSARGRRVALAGFLVAIAGFAAGPLLAGPDRFLRSYLVSFAYFLSLALGGLFFVLLQHLTKAGWSVLVRRLAEAVATAVVPLAVLCLPVLWALPSLYRWADPDHAAGDPLIAHKSGYLNVEFFVARWVLYFVCWCSYALYFHKLSREQDESGDPSLTIRMERASTHGMILYAVTQTFAAFDLLMSLDPHWFSTIFGVYFFGGSTVAIFSLLAVMLVRLQQAGYLQRSITAEHYHDIGKFLFGFVIFWAYIAYSQYMLIWYADIPEETEWFLKRQSGDWARVGLLLIVGHFLVPFLFLLSRVPKRRKGALAAVALWVLAMHWVDLYWVVMPEFSPGRVPLSIADLAGLAAVGGVFVAWTAHRLGRAPLAPVRDPRLAESLALENA